LVGASSAGTRNTSAGRRRRAGPRFELSYQSEGRRGYYGERRFDRSELRGTKLSTCDLEAVRSLGVAVGLDTNVGTVWAQNAGGNFVPARVLP
jgi:hypothetical protein